MALCPGWPHLKHARLADGRGDGPPLDEMDVIPPFGLFNLTSFFRRFSANCIALSLSTLFLLFGMFRPADWVVDAVRGLEPNDCRPWASSEEEASESDSDSDSDPESELASLLVSWLFFVVVCIGIGIRARVS